MPGTVARRLPEGTELPPVRAARIVYVCNDLPYFRLHWHWRAAAAADAGYDVAVVLPCGSHESPGALRMVPLALDRQGIHPLGEWRTYRQLARLLDRLRPDIVHTITSKPNLYGGIWARSRGIPLVASVTGLGALFTDSTPVYRLLRRVVLAAYRHVGRSARVRMLFENEEDRALFLTAGVADDSRAVLSPGVGVDTEVFACHDEPAQGPPVAMLPARMLWAKGVGDFCEAARRLRTHGTPVRMVLVGDTDLDNPGAVPRSQLEAWQREGIVEWWGFRRDMTETLASAHIVCLPSYYREGMPRVLLEAAAIGRPCITTDTAGCRRAVIANETGLLVPPRDPAALATAIAKLAGDSALRRSLGAAGRLRVEREFTQAHVWASTAAIYEVLRGR